MDIKRRIIQYRGFSQILAVLIQNLVTLVIGMNMGYLTILIPPLTNGSEPIFLNETQTSWISSLLSISSLLGSIISGAVTEPFGRKRTMMVLLIPFFIPWICYYFATELWQICVCLIVHGITNGVVEAPVLAYVAEITEPRFRGMLSGVSTMTTIFGIFLQFFIGSFFHWRTAALISCVVPVLTLFFLSFLPETPYWLLSRNKPDQARKSLSWLRNWTAIENIETEFQEIQKNYTKNVEGINNPVFESDLSVTTSVPIDFKHPYTQQPYTPDKLSTVRKYTRKSFLWPFFLILFVFTLSNFAGNYTLQTFGVIIFSTFKVPIQKYNATVLLGAVQFVGSLLCIFFVRLCGKRVIGFVSISSVCICNALLGVYSYLNGIIHLDFTDDSNLSVQEPSTENNWIPLVLFIAMAFVSHLGTKNLPWMLIGEIFSNDTRGVGCGLATSTYYISGFAATKIYLTMVSTLTLPGVFCAYSCICIIGTIVIYFVLPETEGKTLEEISQHFSGRSKLNNKVKR